MNIFILIVSVALGFALACLICAVLLHRSNDIGNSTGMIEDYKIDISFDVSNDRLDPDIYRRDEVDMFCDKYYRSIAQDIKEPASDKYVEQVPGKQIELEDITAIYVDG